MAVYGGRASDFPAGSQLSQIQPLDAFVFAGPGNKPSANLTETLIPGREPYQLSHRQDAAMALCSFSISISEPPSPPFGCSTYEIWGESGRVWLSSFRCVSNSQWLFVTGHGL